MLKRRGHTFLVFPFLVKWSFLRFSLCFFVKAKKIRSGRLIKGENNRRENQPINVEVWCEQDDEENNAPNTGYNGSEK